MNTYFPNPSEHAVAMLEARGTIETARFAADTNRHFAHTDKDFRYWSFVYEALSTEASCRAN
jgi:hypothetical protein